MGNIYRHLWNIDIYISITTWLVSIDILTIVHVTLDLFNYLLIYSLLQSKSKTNNLNKSNYTVFQLWPPSEINDFVFNVIWMKSSQYRLWNGNITYVRVIHYCFQRQTLLLHYIVLRTFYYTRIKIWCLIAHNSHRSWFAIILLAYLKIMLLTINHWYQTISIFMLDNIEIRILYSLIRAIS